MTILVFDIETVPDIEEGRKLYKLDGLSDKDTANAMFSLRRTKTGNEFLPHYLQKIVAISSVISTDSGVKVWSLGDPESSEKELIQRFFKGLDKYTPTLVSWNGSGFDLPVLHFRSLLHKICAQTYWDAGDKNRDFRYNNYLSRYHYRHIDLMDILAAYQMKAFAPLDEIATMLGFPGKMGMSGNKVWDEYQQGNLLGIRNYCETDVLNTYCVFLRFELMRGIINEEIYDAKIAQLKKYLLEENIPHLSEFSSYIHST